MSAAAIAICAITGVLTASGSSSKYAWLEAIARMLTVAAPIAVGLVAPVPVTSCDVSCPANAFMVSGSEPAVIEDVVRPLRELITIALFATVTGRLAQRLRDDPSHAPRARSRAGRGMLSLRRLRRRSRGVCFLPVLIDRQRRGLHDYLAGTIVLYRGYEPVPREVATR